MPILAAQTEADTLLESRNKLVVWKKFGSISASASGEPFARTIAIQHFVKLATRRCSEANALTSTGSLCIVRSPGKT